MKALVYEKYGSSDVLEIKEVRKPKANGHDILVKIYSSSINGADHDMLRGSLFGRFSGPFKPGYKTLGSDVAGVVEGLGKDVKHLKIGDEVFGDMTEYGFACFAEYICVPEKALSKKPSSMTFDEAAAIPSAAVIALQAIENYKSIQAGDKVLVNGAGGGMGTFAIQIAKSFGAEVTGVDSGEKLDKLLEIGADYVIDYKKENFTKMGKKYDRIIDCQAFNSLLSYNRVLNTDGIYFMIGGAPYKLFTIGLLGLIVSKFNKKKIGLLLGRPNDKNDMMSLIDLFERDKFTPVINKSFPLSDIKEAFTYFEEGKFVGKVVINMAKK